MKKIYEIDDPTKITNKPQSLDSTNFMEYVHNFMEFFQSIDYLAIFTFIVIPIFTIAIINKFFKSNWRYLGWIAVIFISLQNYIN